MMALTGVGVLVGCSSDKPQGLSTPAASPSTPATSPTATGPVVCAEIPQETAGPFPGNGSNGPNALSESGIVRRDIRSSIGGSSTVARGVPLTINIALLDRAKACAPLAGAALYLWHCDREGRYSMYSQGVTDENYLRGVQQADSRGMVTFRSIFPAAYSGRWPHIHFEVYPSLSAARSGGNTVATSQLAFPEPVCDEVYATDGYEQSVRNMQRLSLDSDNVFRDGYAQQLATVTGGLSSGIVANLSVPV